MHASVRLDTSFHFYPHHFLFLFIFPLSTIILRLFPLPSKLRRLIFYHLLVTLHFSTGNLSLLITLAYITFLHTVIFLLLHLLYTWDFSPSISSSPLIFDYVIVPTQHAPVTTPHTTPHNTLTHSNLSHPRSIRPHLPSRCSPHSRCYPPCRPPRPPRSFRSTSLTWHTLIHPSRLCRPPPHLRTAKYLLIAPLSKLRRHLTRIHRHRHSFLRHPVHTTTTTPRIPTIPPHPRTIPHFPPAALTDHPVGGTTSIPPTHPLSDNTLPSSIYYEQQVRLFCLFFV